MKTKILTFLFVLGCCGFAFSQGDPGCPTVQIDVDNIAFPTDACVGQALDICLDTDGVGDLSAVNITGIVIAGGPDPGFTISQQGTQICISATPLLGADPCAPYTLEITLGGATIMTTDPACGSGLVGINAINVPFLDTFTSNDINDALPLLSFAGADPINVTVYPMFTVTETPPACDGAAGSAELIASDDTVCSTVAGTAGVTNVCPAIPPGMPATLVYDFTADVGESPCPPTPIMGDISLPCDDACGAVCAIEADLAAAPTAPTVTESMCAADGMTLEGGMIDYSGTTCPAMSTLEYSTDGGTNWVAVAPAYDQTTAITVTVRCLCDEDMMTASATAEVTTMPGECPQGMCTVVAGEPAIPSTDVCPAGQGPGPNGEMELTPTMDDLMTLSGTPAPTGTNANGAAPTVNYVITDAAGVVLDVVGNVESMTYDFSPFYGAVGSSFCVYQAAYTQETIDDIAMALNNVLCSTLCAGVAGCVGDLLAGGCPVLATPTELAGVLDVLNSVFALAGQPLTASDVDDFLNNQVITIPTGSVGIPGISDFDFNLADFGLEICGDLSNAGACFTVVDCNEPCDPAVCNNVTYTITSFDWTGLDDQFTLGTEGDDTDLELAYTINGVPYQLDGGAAGSDAQASGQTITGATSPPPPGTVSYEVCFWENDCGNDTDYDNDTGLFGPCLGNADDPFGDGANEGAATACEMITFDIAANTATGTNYTVNYTVTCEPIEITNVMPMPDAVCNGDNAEYTVCFDVAGGSGNYDLVEAANTATVLGTVAGADGNLCIGPVTIVGPTAASTLDVTVVDQANVLCLGNATTINIPMCPVTVPMCEITDITEGTPVCAADGLTYDVTVTVTGTDASVTLDDGTGAIAATTTTFTFNSGAGYTITVADTDVDGNNDPLCAFGPFTGADPACPTEPAEFNFGISDPCACADDETAPNAGDGTFTEVVTVWNDINMDGIVDAGEELPSTTIVTITAQTGMYMGGNVGGTPVPGGLVPTGMTLTPIATGAGNIYEIGFNHVNNQGYTVTVDVDIDGDGVAEGSATISNLCTYPSPVVMEFEVDGTCFELDGAVVSLTGMDENENGSVAAAENFTVNGVATNMIDPAVLGVGMYTVTYEYTAAADGNNGISPDGGTTPAAPGCTATIETMIEISESCTVENIPTVGEWGLIILGLMMSITAIVGIRQRREEEAYS